MATSESGLDGRATRHRLPFAGRQRERTVVRDALARAAVGDGRLLLVAGAMGAGKSRLLEEVADDARAAGWLVLAGRTVEAEGMPPYVPFIEALRPYILGQLPAILRQQLGDGAADIARLIPEAGQLVIDSARVALPPEYESYRLLDGVTSFILTIAGQRDDAAVPPSATERDGRLTDAAGLLLLLDDLQWADRPSLLLLQRLTARMAGARLLIIAAYQDDALEPGRPLAVMLPTLRRDHRCERLRVGGLAADDVLRLVEASAVMPAGRDRRSLATAIHRQTEGNPLFIEEVLAHIQAGDAAGSEPRDEPRLLDSLRDLVGRRLARLSPDSASILARAAVFGQRFSFDVLRQLIDGGTDDDTLLATIEEALTAGILEEAVDHGRPAYLFHQSIARRVLEERLSAVRRQRLHLRAAEAIEQIHAGDLTPHVATLAIHYQSAGAAARGQALTYTVRAAEAAQSVFAWEQAATAYQAALDLLGEQPAPPEQRADLLMALAGVWRSAAGEQRRRVDCLEEGARLYDAAGDTAAATRARLEAVEALTALGPAQDLDRARDHLGRIEADGAGDGETTTAALVHYALARVHLFAVRTEPGVAAARRAMAIAERLGDERLQARIAPVLASHLFAGGDLTSALAVLERGWQIGDRLNDSGLTFTASATAVALTRLLHDYAEAARWCERELAASRRAVWSGGREVVLAYLARAHGELGRIELARGLLRDFPAAPESTVAAGFLDTALARWAGDWELLDDLIEGRLGADQRAGNRLLQAEGLIEAAPHWWMQGKSERARQAVEQALAIAVSGGHRPLELAARIELALLDAGGGRGDDARRQIARCQELIAGGLESRGLAGRRLLAGSLLEAEDAPPDAGGPLPRQPDATADHYPAPWDEAEAHLRRARLPVSAGRPTATAAGAAAAAIYRRIGAGERWITLAEHIDGGWAGLPSRPASSGVNSETSEPESTPATAPSTAHSATNHEAEQRADRPARDTDGAEANPDRLSDREIEVLRLLADGRRNPEIAEALVISLNTVYRHVSNIYAKANLANRVEAANYARRLGLAG